MDGIHSSLASTQALDSLADARVGKLRGSAQSSPEEAAARFEELLASMLVKEMRNALPEGFFGKSTGSDVYGGWLDEHLGKAIAETGGLGLRDVLLPGLGGATEVADESSDAEAAR